jgi:hypothetical protein
MNAERVEERFFILETVNSDGQPGFCGWAFPKPYVLFSLSARVNPFLGILENFPS